MSNFYAFPRTPHIEGSVVVDDDKSMSTSSLRTLLKKGQGEYVVVCQEKVDGTNVSVHFEQDWVPTIQKRSGLLGSGEHAQYEKFRGFVNQNIEVLWNALGTGYCLFGEWLWCLHGVKYNRLRSFFLAFDLFDKRTGKFLSHDKLLEVCGEEIQTVPVLYKGPTIPEEKGFFLSLIKKSTFSDTETAEGVYIRLEKNNEVAHRVKLRRDTFVSGREDFGRKIVNNELIDE